MPPRESLREEARRRGVSLYRVRIGRGRVEHLTKRTAVGKGPLPTAVARKVERQRRGHPRALPVKTQEKYRSEIAAYERKRYRRLTTATPRPRRFNSKAEAQAWAADNQMEEVLDAYGEIRKVGGQWEVRLLR